MPFSECACESAAPPTSSAPPPPLPGPSLLRAWLQMASFPETDFQICLLCKRCAARRRRSPPTRRRRRPRRRPRHRGGGTRPWRAVPARVLPCRLCRPQPRGAPRLPAAAAAAARRRAARLRCSRATRRSFWPRRRAWTRCLRPPSCSATCSKPWWPRLMSRRQHRRAGAARGGHGNHCTTRTTRTRAAARRCRRRSRPHRRRLRRPARRLAAPQAPRRRCCCAGPTAAARDEGNAARRVASTARSTCDNCVRAPACASPRTTTSRRPAWQRYAAVAAAQQPGLGRPSSQRPLSLLSVFPERLLRQHH